jgi:hypothetical protein
VSKGAVAKQKFCDGPFLVEKYSKSSGAAHLKGVGCPGAYKEGVRMNKFFAPDYLATAAYPINNRFLRECAVNCGFTAHT